MRMIKLILCLSFLLLGCDDSSPSAGSSSDGTVEQSDMGMAQADSGSSQIDQGGAPIDMGAVEMAEPAYASQSLTTSLNLYPERHG